MDLQPVRGAPAVPVAARAVVQHGQLLQHQPRAAVVQRPHLRHVYRDVYGPQVVRRHIGPHGGLCAAHSILPQLLHAVGRAGGVVGNGVGPHEEIARQCLRQPIIQRRSVAFPHVHRWLDTERLSGGSPDGGQQPLIHALILCRQLIQIGLHRVGRLPVPRRQRISSALGIRAVAAQQVGAQVAEGTRLPVRQVHGIIHDAVIRRVDAHRVVLHFTGPWRDLLIRRACGGEMRRHRACAAGPEPHREALAVRHLDGHGKRLVQRQAVRAALHPDVAAGALRLAVVHLRDESELLQHGGRAALALVLRRHLRRHDDPQLAGELAALIGHVRQPDGHAVVTGDAGGAVIDLPSAAHGAGDQIGLQRIDQLPQTVHVLPRRRDVVDAVVGHPAQPRAVYLPRHPFQIVDKRHGQIAAGLHLLGPRAARSRHRLILAGVAQRQAVGRLLGIQPQHEAPYALAHLVQPDSAQNTADGGVVAHIGRPHGVQRLRVPCTVSRRLPPAGAGQEAHGDDRRRDDQQHRRPNSRFFPVHGILHPFLYRHLAEGQRAYRRRTLPHGAGHQRPGIGGAPRAVHIPQHPLVTGVLHVPPQQDIRRPQHRVEPVQRQQQKCQRLYEVVAPPDVAPLMGQHLRQRRVVHTLRHVDAGTEQPQHKGCPPRAAAVHVVLQPYRRAYPAVDAQIADQHICQHHHHTRQPDRRQQRHGHHRLGCRYGLCPHDFRRRQRRHRLCRAAGQHLVRFLRRLLRLGQLVQRRRHRALRRL